MSRKFYTLDVFTNTNLTGNPLAVVLDCEGLDDQKMQAIATEFNLSETVFVFPPKNKENRAAIQIYTPAHELPFAGHPTIGTAILLNQLVRPDDGEEFVLEEKIGPIRCMISGSEPSKAARFDLPKLSEQLSWEFDLDLMAQALGLESDDLEFGEHLVGLWNGGVPYTMVPVKSMEVIQRIKIDTNKLAKVEPMFDGIAANPYVYCAGGETADTDFHARMFAPLFGIPEDPATGSAVASFSGLLAQVEMDDTDQRTFKIEQGYEMGRPSQIYLDMEKRNGEVVSAGISGSAVIVSEGFLRL